MGTDAALLWVQDGAQWRVWYVTGSGASRAWTSNVRHTTGNHGDQVSVLPYAPSLAERRVFGDEGGREGRRDGGHTLTRVVQPGLRGNFDNILDWYRAMAQLPSR